MLMVNLADGCSRPLPVDFTKNPPNEHICFVPLSFPPFETTPLYLELTKRSRVAFRDAYEILSSMTEEEVRNRSAVDRRTYLHVVIDQAPILFKKYGSVVDLVPIIYHLALRGVVVNAQDNHGNTCLHLACLRPNAQSLCVHLLRIGADPCIPNNKGIRIVHTYRNHVFQLVKGESNVRSGLWDAVKREDVAATERLMKTWCRANIARNKTIHEMADETSNERLVRVLDRYTMTNELACAAFACDVERVRAVGKLLGLDKDSKEWEQEDEAWDVPKPLTVSLGELGFWTQDVIKVLFELGAPPEDRYKERLKLYRREFENSKFYKLVKEATDESLVQAADLIMAGQVDVRLTSASRSMNGWTYLHFVVNQCMVIWEKNEERARLLIRAIYRLALAGIDVNARDAKGNTALILSTAKRSQDLVNHLIRIGSDSTIPDAKGRRVSEEVYEGRGRLIFGKKYRVVDLPGLWAAVKRNDVEKTERWLKSWCRVKIYKGDRSLIDVARSLGHKDIVDLLEAYLHINEFVCATFAGNKELIMNVLALGNGQRKVNTIDDFFHVGYKWSLHSEFIHRPIIVSALELCTPQVVDFLLNFHADLSMQYEEKYPCGPTAFWAFRDHVSNDVALVVVKYADVKLRDELGCTMLHRIVAKQRLKGKTEVIKMLLERGVDIAARDFEGSTARDYIAIHQGRDSPNPSPSTGVIQQKTEETDNSLALYTLRKAVCKGYVGQLCNLRADWSVKNGAQIRQLLDDYVLDLVDNDQCNRLETLLLSSYDHITDIRGTSRLKTAQELAELKQYNQILRFLKEIDKYKSDINALQEAAKCGDSVTIAKLAGERRNVFTKDRAGRTLLHTAVLYDQPLIVKYLVEQYPILINSRDNLDRTPLHYCVCLKDRHLTWPTLQEGLADPNLTDANNLSVYDYVRQLEKPTPVNDKPRGRRWRNYSPSADLITYEREARYGFRAGEVSENAWPDEEDEDEEDLKDSDEKPEESQVEQPTTETNQEVTENTEPATQ